MRLAFLALCLLALPGVVAAQAVGPEFQVNTYTTGYQNVDLLGRSVAIDPSGDFVVTWFHFPIGPMSRGIYARRYEADGTPKGAPFLVNSYTTGSPMFPSVVSDDSGGFLVVWDHKEDDDLLVSRGLFARRYDAAGTPQGPEFKVNSSTLNDQYYSSVAMNGSGAFVVAWDANRLGASDFGIFAQRYDAAGAAQGPRIHVNTYTTGEPVLPAVAMDPAGNFVVVWNVDLSGSGPAGLQGQRFDANGVPQGGEFRVNEATTTSKVWPSAAMAPDGSFLVAWQDGGGRDGSNAGVFARRFDALGAAQGGDLQVNTYTTGTQGIPRASADVDGGFVVSWVDTGGRDGSAYGAIAQRYDASGAPRGPEFVVNSYTTGRQTYPTIAVNPGGQAVAIYADLDGRDGSQTGVFGQRFSFALDETAPAVTVTSPNGGEILYTGFPFAIRWTASDAVGIDHFGVEYSTDAGSHWTPVPGCASLAANETKCSWNAPGPVTTKGRIRVTATDTSNNVGSDTSNANYQVADGAPFVALTIPDAPGLSWQAGTTKSVKWSHNLGKNQACSLELNRDFPSGPWELVTTNAVTTAKTTSSYAWVVPSGATSGASARLRLSWNQDASIEDVSGNGFAITSRVKVTQPNGPINWPSGGTRVIKWTHNLGTAATFRVGVDRNGDSVCEETLASSVPASAAKAGLYSWKVCGASPARICVTSSADPLDTDLSDAAFNITGSPLACP